MFTPPPQDDLHLLLPVDFLNSTYCPKLCLYSGRTENVSRIRHLLYISSSDGHLRLPVLIPTAYGERVMNNFLRRGLPMMGAATALAGMPLMAYGMVVAARRMGLFFGNHPAPSILITAIILAGAVYVGLYGLYRWWARHRFIEWRLRSALRAVDVTFPERHRVAYVGWCRALDAWDAAGRPTDDGLSLEEGWSAQVQAGWDQPTAPLN